VTTLEISDIDVRSFSGWHVLSETLRSLIVRRGNINDPSELIIDLVLDDAERRRHRSSRHVHSPSYINEPRLSSPPLPHASPPPTQTRPVPDSDSPEVRFNRATSPRPSSSRSNSSSKGRAAMYRSSSVISNSSLSSSTSNLNLHSLPEDKWQSLKFLCLIDCSLHTLTAPAWSCLAANLVSLDLSDNLFIEIPSVLSSLYCLRSLNLAGNMIEKLQGLNLISLPAITTLILRDNRLVSLAGIERGARNLITYSICIFLANNRLDIRGNLIADVSELSRLTAAPYMQHLWVSRNPFTRIHSNTYRLTIFNFFRHTPGFTEDVTIDGSSPGMVERRHLDDRVLEKPPAPPASVRLQSPPPLQSSGDTSTRRVETIGRNAKKKKTNRQRVVSLDDSSVVVAPSVGHAEGGSAEGGTDDYRKRLEALREEAGAGWLKVLSESGGLTENGLQNASGK
jgi:Leucine-rich repeat (LRR) protein